LRRCHLGGGLSDIARLQYDHLWALAHAERAALAKDLAGLGAEQWRHDTLGLVMSMAGRVSYLAELDGPGVPTLRSRLQATAA
jgi:hypothetical protein